MTLQQEYREKYNEGLEAGIEQGLERGIQRGIEQGKIEGKTEGKIEILYVDLHFSIAEIAQKLKVSEEHVQGIVKKIEDQK